MHPFLLTFENAQLERRFGRLVAAHRFDRLYTIAVMLIMMGVVLRYYMDGSMAFPALKAVSIQWVLIAVLLEIRRKTGRTRGWGAKCYVLSTCAARLMVSVNTALAYKQWSDQAGFVGKDFSTAVLVSSGVLSPLLYAFGFAAPFRFHLPLQIFEVGIFSWLRYPDWDDYMVATFTNGEASRFIQTVNWCADRWMSAMYIRKPVPAPSSAKNPYLAIFLLVHLLSMCLASFGLWINEYRLRYRFLVSLPPEDVGNERIRRLSLSFILLTCAPVMCGAFAVLWRLIIEFPYIRDRWFVYV